MAQQVMPGTPSIHHCVCQCACGSSGSVATCSAHRLKVARRGHAPGQQVLRLDARPVHLAQLAVGDANVAACSGRSAAVGRSVSTRLAQRPTDPVRVPRCCAMACTAVPPVMPVTLVAAHHSGEHAG